MVGSSDHYYQEIWLQAALPLLTTPASLLSPSTGSASLCTPASIWFLAAFILLCIAAAIIVQWAAPGGPAWSWRNTIPGPRGLPFMGSLLEMGEKLAHRRLAELAKMHNASELMALSLGCTRVVVAVSPSSAKQILTSASFASRPVKESARLLLFERSMGFAPYGSHWRCLRRLAAAHLFSPKMLEVHEKYRRLEASALVESIVNELQRSRDHLCTVRPFLDRAALNGLMSCLCGKRFDFVSEVDQGGQELLSMVREGFELLGAFNVADHLPVLQALDPLKVRQRCEALLPRVNAFFLKILEEQRSSLEAAEAESTFVCALLNMDGKDKLTDKDIIAVAWEMIFRGTDSVAILVEWSLAELVLNPNVQATLAEEIVAVAGNGHVSDAHVAKMPFLEAVVNEALRLHPPGPLLSWARMAEQDVEVAGHIVPAGTTAMVNMWALMREPGIWAAEGLYPTEFRPERFMGGSVPVDSRGGELHFAPFGAGRRMCPGRALGLASAQLWLARLVQSFHWGPAPGHPVDLSEHLKLSCEMKTSLVARLTSR